jgi:drug/metabolite transporter (DMT)-like permease
MTTHHTALTSAHITALLFGLTGIFGALIHASASVITLGRAGFAVLAFGLGDQGTVGLLWGLASGLSFALLAMTNRRAAKGVDAVQVSFWQNVTVAFVMVPFAASELIELRSFDWLNLALLGIFCTGLSQYLFVKSLEGLNARSAGMIISLEPVYAIACAWWLFNEAPSYRMLAGATLIVLAILLSAQVKSPSASTVSH